MDCRVQRLDPALQDFRRTRDIRHLADVQAALPGQRPVRAAGADQFVAGIGDAAGEFHHAGFVVYTDKRSQTLLRDSRIGGND